MRFSPFASACNRRAFLQKSALSAAAFAGSRGIALSGSARTGVLSEPSIRAITQEPGFHWFGYYDKRQFDNANQLVLGNRVAFEHRTPRADDAIEVGMVDTAQGDRWIALGESRAWGWQQGCMLQWVPGRDRTVIWNDREQERLVARLLDVETRRRTTLPAPVYTLSPDGRFGLFADFARIQAMRPGYGYVGVEDACADDPAPAESGVSRIDLDSGETQLVLSLADIAAIPWQGQVLRDVKHYVNHLLIGPSGERFAVLHRWRRLGNDGQVTGGFSTRMITANCDGGDVYVLDPSGHTSHFIWRDDRHLCMWTRPQGKKPGFYLLEDRTQNIVPVGVGHMIENGHNTYVPATDNAWILCDTYPDSARQQKPFLFHVPSATRVDLGAFRSPAAYRGEWRCDTHPRSSNDGRWVCIDSPHGDNGRQMYLIDVGEILDGIR